MSVPQIWDCVSAAASQVICAIIYSVAWIQEHRRIVKRPFPYPEAPLHSPRFVSRCLPGDLIEANCLMSEKDDGEASFFTCSHHHVSPAATADNEVISSLKF